MRLRITLDSSVVEDWQFHTRTRALTPTLSGLSNKLYDFFCYLEELFRFRRTKKTEQSNGNCGCWLIAVKKKKSHQQGINWEWMHPLIFIYLLNSFLLIRQKLQRMNEYRGRNEGDRDRESKESQYIHSTHQTKVRLFAGIQSRLWETWAEQYRFFVFHQNIGRLSARRLSPYIFLYFRQTILSGVSRLAPLHHRAHNVDKCRFAQATDHTIYKHI